MVHAIIAAFNGAYIGAAIATHFNLRGWKKTLCMAGGAVLMGLVGWFFPLANLYAAVKDILYIAGSTFLLCKGYYIAADAYTHGMWAAGRALSTRQKNALITAIRKSKEYREKKEEMQRRNSSNNVLRGVLEFSETKDLYFTIQHMNITLTYVPHQKRYRVMLYDVYDFTEWRKIMTESGASFSNAANNLGLMMQKCGMMIPYEISLQFYDK